MSDNLNRLLTQIYFSDIRFDDLEQVLSKVLVNETEIFPSLRAQIKAFVNSKLKSDSIDIAWEVCCQLEAKAEEIAKVVNLFSKLQNKDISKFDAARFHMQYFFLEAPNLQIKNSRELHDKFKEGFNQGKLKQLYKLEREGLNNKIKFNYMSKEEIKWKMDLLLEEELQFDQEITDFELRLLNAPVMEPEKLLIPNLSQDWIDKYYILLNQK